MYDRLLELPLFQGLSRDQLTEILEKVPFHFQQYKPGDMIFNPGEPCEHVTFILSGEVRLVTPTYAGRIIISQDFGAPHTMPFYYLFGVETRYPNALYALDPTGVMQLDKEGFLKCLQTNSILLINMLNILSTHAQKQHYAMNFAGEDDPVLRLASWLLAFSFRPATSVYFDAHEADWCHLLQLDSPSFWRSVAVLEGDGILEVVNGKLKLLDRYGLRTFVSRKSGKK